MGASGVPEARGLPNPRAVNRTRQCWRCQGLSLRPVHRHLHHGNLATSASTRHNTAPQYRANQYVNTAQQRATAPSRPVRQHGTTLRCSIVPTSASTQHNNALEHGNQCVYMARRPASKKKSRSSHRSGTQRVAAPMCHAPTARLAAARSLSLSTPLRPGVVRSKPCHWTCDNTRGRPVDVSIELSLSFPGAGGGPALPVLPPPPPLASRSRSSTSLERR